MKTFMEFAAREQEGIGRALQDVILKMPSGVRDIAGYALLSGGKRLRPVLTLLWFRLLESSAQIRHDSLSVYDASVVLEMFHVASLLHDDVLDNADLRRGKTAAHLKFGVRPCLLAGDALLAMGNRQMAQFGNTALMDIISEALLKTAVGEIDEIALAGKIPQNEKEYLDVIEGKTAWIIRSACEVGAVMAGADAGQVRMAREFGLNLGMAFQIVDDALDFSPEEIIGKPAGGDLRERKCTPPVYMYMQTLGEQEKADFVRKFSVLPDPVFGEQKRDGAGFCEEELENITRAIVGNGFPEKTRELAQVYLDRAMRSLEGFSGIYRDMLAEAVEYVRSRNK